MAGVIASLVVRVSANLAELDKSFSALERGAAKVQKTYERLGSQLTSIGGKLTTAVTLPIVGLGAAATKSFADFDTAMKGVEAALGPTGAEMQSLTNAAIEWGQKTKFSATEAATALGELGKAGFTTEQSIAALPATLQLATVSGMNLADTATLTADTIKQFGLEVADAARINDVLVQAAQASTIDVRQLGESFKYVGPTAKTVGMTIEQTAAAVALLGNAGIKADMAGTGLQAVLSKIVNPTKKTRDVMAELGIATLESAPGVVKLTDVMATLEARGATSAQILKAFGDQGGRTLLSAMGQGVEALKGLETQMTTSAGAAEKASAIMQSGIGGALEQMSGAVETAGIALGELLAPAVEWAADKLGALAEWVTSTLVPAFKALPDSVKIGAGALLGIAAAAGPAFYALGTLISGFGAAAGAVRQMSGFMADGAKWIKTLTAGLTLESAAAWLATAATTAFEAIVAVLTSPITLVIGAIAALVLGLRYLTGSWEGVLQVLTLGLVDFGTLGRAWEFLKTAAAALGDAFGALGDGIRARFSAAIQAAIPYVVAIWDALKSVYDTVAGAFVSAWDALGGAVSGVASSGFGSLVAAIGDFLVTVGSWAFVEAGRMIWGYLETQVAAVGAIFRFLGGVVQWFLSAVWDYLATQINAVVIIWKALVGVVNDYVIPAFKAIGEWIAPLIGALDTLAGKAADAISTITANIPGAITLPNVADPFKAAEDAARAAAPPIAQVGTNLAALNATAAATPGKLAPTATGLGTVKTSAKGAKDAIGELVGELGGKKALKAAEDMLAALKQLPGVASLTKDAQERVNKVMSAAIDVYDALKQKAPAAMRATYEATLAPLSVNSQIREFVQNARAITFVFDAWTSYTPELARVSDVLAGMPALPMPDEAELVRLAAARASMADFVSDLQSTMADAVGAFATGAASIGDVWRSLWGSLTGYASSIVSDIVKGFTTQIAKALAGGTADFGSVLGGMTSGQSAVVGAGVGAAVGYGVGSKYGKAKGALAGAAAGAAAGSIVPGFGTAIGAGVGALAGWLGGRKREKEMRQQMEADRAELLKTYGTMEKLRGEAVRLGVDIDKAFSTKKPEEFGKILGELEKKVEAENKAIAKLSSGLEAVSSGAGLLTPEIVRQLHSAPPGAGESIFSFYEQQTKTTIDKLGEYLASGLKTVKVKDAEGVEIDKTVLAAGAIKTQGGATAVGASIAAVYSDLLDQGLSTRDAFRELNPLIAAFTEQTTLAGLQGGAAMASLQAQAAYVADEFAGPALDSVAAVGGALTSIFNTGNLTQETFAGLTGEITATYDTLEAMGKGGELAIRGMQPSLQKVWELSQDFGYELDENTQRVLGFAQEAGLVGDKFRPAADRMAAAIDKLVSKFDVFLDRLTVDAGVSAGKAVDAMGRVFGGAKIPPVKIPTEYEPPTGRPPWEDAAERGVVPPPPTYAPPGSGVEGAPAAAAPDFEGAGNVEANFYLDGDLVARSVTRRQPGILRGYGATR